MMHTNKSKEIIINAGLNGDNFVFISVIDNGCGIPENNLITIFNHGFTTKADGHGFGLHTSANAMTEMGGKLTVTSNGIEHGACFTLNITNNGELKKSVYQ